MNISIIIPAYNNERTIGLVLDSLSIQQYDRGDVEIIVIDDGSSDKTVEISKRYGVNVIENEKNIGLANSLNRGINRSKYEVVVTLHGDTVPLERTWLKELTDQLNEPGVAASCSLQDPYDYTKDDLSIWIKFWARSTPHHALNNKADAYKKDVLRQIGMFDGRTYKTAGEDEDIALRLRLNCKRIIGSSAKVRHMHYYSHHSSYDCLIKILKKVFTFGQAGGALRRKFPFYKPSVYIFPIPKSFVNDGAFKTMVSLGCFIPYIQVICIPLLLITCFFGITEKIKYGAIKTLFLYPIFRILTMWIYALGYCIGIATGRQS